MARVKLPRQWKFGSIPEEILLSDLSIFAKVTIGAITYHSFDDGPAYPGINRLARLGSMNRKSVMKAIEELEKEGFLKVDRVDGKSNSYEFLSKTSPSQGLVENSPVLRADLTSPSQGPKTSKPVLPRDSNETKPNETKNKTLTPQGEFVDWFKSQYETKFGKPYVESKADYIQAVGILKLFKIETLKELVAIAWVNKDAFVQKASMTVKGFVSVVNQLSLPSKTGTKIIPGSPTGQLALQAKWKKEQDEELQRRKASGG